MNKKQLDIYQAFWDSITKPKTREACASVAFKLCYGIDIESPKPILEVK